ncbi:MAG: VCBS repeat-containing protein [Pyrinomonadaceae bacterium]
MNNLTLFIICLVLIFFLGISVQGQTKAQKTTLNKAIGTYAAKTIKALNKNGDSFKYSLTNKNVFYNDLDGDGEFDAVVEMFFCERTSCHPTTNSSELVVYLNKKGSFTFIASKGFSLYGKINSIEDGKIRVDIYGLDEDDPQCCPQLKRSEIYSLKNNKLVKVKK